MSGAGWGPPPGPGSFGAPPGGGPPPGGPMPPGGGGEAPLGHIPFTSEEEGYIRQASMAMKVAGGAAVASAVLGVIVNAVGGVLAETGNVGGAVVQGGVGVATQVVLAALLFRASTSFEKMVDTDGEDQALLVAGIKDLRVYFLVKVALWILGILVCCCCGAALMFFGTAVMAAFAGAAAGQ